jgi:type I restriction enzyme S subunit
MSWEKVKLGRICDSIQTGKTPPTSNPDFFIGNINWFNPSDIGVNKVLSDSKRKISKQAVSEGKATIFQKDTILLTCIGEIGRCGVLREGSSSNQQITALKFSNKVTSSFAYYWFIKNKKKLESIANHALVPILNNALLKEVFFEYPPLPIQQKIAAILDTADVLRKKDRQLLYKYDELLQSIFYDMFGDPVKNEKEWEKGTIRNVVTEVKYGTSKPSEESGVYKYLRMNNITYGGDWDFSSLKYINLTEEERPKYLLRKGDLIFNRTNSKELVGKTAVYNLDEAMAIAGYLIRVRTNEKASPIYLSAYLNSKHGKAVLMAMCKNIIGMANINAQELQDIKIHIPPIALQNQFATIVQNIQQQKQVVKLQIEQSENLFQSLLQRAFRGELVKE